METAKDLRTCREVCIMEPIELFAMALLAICIIHLATTASARIESWWGRKMGRKRPTKRKRGERGDWYAFFHCVDLVGPAPRPDTSVPRSLEHAETAKRQGRNTDKRPRINA